MSIAIDLVRDGALIGGTVLATLAVEHGWGWVLTTIKARAARAKNQTASVFTEMQGQVNAAVAGKLAETAVYDRLGALEAKVFGATASTTLPSNKL